MTIAADKTGAQQGTVSTPSAAPSAAGTHPASDGAARPVLAHDKRRALGRGLESLLPGPRPAGGGLGSAGSGIGSGSPGAARTSGGGSAAAGAVSGDVGAASTTAVPGVIAELQAQAARKLDGHEVLDLLITSIDVNP